MSRRRPAPRPVPDRLVESALLVDHDLVAGMDEVGRGSLAGPVTVALAVVGRHTPDSFPPGLADSKLLTARRRRELAGPCRDWAVDAAVAHSTPAEIDELGIVAALRLAGMRALAEVAGRGHAPGVVLLDGVADWLSAPAADLLDSLDGAAGRQEDGRFVVPVPPVRMEVKGDARCAVIAAASVLAKVERDGFMERLEDPGYGWAANKGYASPAHIRALGRLGASEHHRRSWRLPGLADAH